MVALLHASHRARAGILVREAADHVVEQSLAQRAVRDAHLLDLERFEQLGENRQAARKHRGSLRGHFRQANLVDVARLDGLVDQSLQAFGRDGDRCRIEMADAVGDDADRAGTAHRVLPALRPERRLHRLELEPRRHACAPQALLRDLAVAKVRQAHTDAAHVQALEPQRIEAFADDELGAAAADVHHQSPARVVGNRVGDAEIDEARLFDAGDDFDRMAESIARALQECLLAMRLAQSVGADDTHALRVHVAQSLPEAFAGTRALAG